MRHWIIALPVLFALVACGDTKDDTAPSEDTAPPEDTDTNIIPGFAADVLPVLTDNCGGCHGANEARAGLDVTTHASLMASGYVTAGDGAGSRLITVGSHHGSGWFDTAEQETIVAWIDEDALDN